MRILALIAVVWSFVGMPTLCDVPDKCPNGCPCDTSDDAPDDEDSSHPRDCDSCTESCNVVSTHSKPTDGDDFASMFVVAIDVVQIPCDALLPHQLHSYILNTEQLSEHIPIPASDRPRLI